MDKTPPVTTDELLRKALIEFHEFVCEHLDHDSLPLDAYLAGWDALDLGHLRELLNCDNPLIREYAENIWQSGFRLDQALIVQDAERTLYAQGDDKKLYVVVADV